MWVSLGWFTGTTAALENFAGIPQTSLEPKDPVQWAIHTSNMDVDSISSSLNVEIPGFSEEVTILLGPKRNSSDNAPLIRVYL